MSKYLKSIHDAVGDFTDVSAPIEEAICELARRLDWYYNAQTYIDACNELIPALSAIDGTDDLCREIRDKVANHRPFDIDYVREIIQRGYYKDRQYNILFGQSED